MTKLKICLPITIALLALMHLSSMGQEKNSERYQGMEIGSETRVLESKINGKKYKLYISLPESYSEENSKEYPVFYIMDGEGYFPIVYSGYKGLLYDGFLPEIIIVGLTYAGEDPDIRNLRSSDFTPTPIPNFPTSGGAAKFMEVFRNEIIPFIDSEYRTNKVDRALGGNSFGGLITHYALFNATDLFNGYVICNGSLMYAPGVTFQYEEAYSKKNTELKANVFMVSGEYDNVPAFENMLEQINSRNYAGLNLESGIVEGMGHVGATNEAFSRGLKSIYKIRGITLAEDLLNEYTGNYAFAPGQSAKIEVAAENLVVKTIDQAPPIKLEAMGQDKFSLNGTYRFLYFVRGAKEEVTGYKVEFGNNRVLNVKKID